MRRIIMASITAVVVIAVLAGTLIPVLDDATAKTDTFENEGYFNVTYLETSDDVTLVWDHTDPTAVTINDEEYDLSALTLDTTILCGDNWIVRYRPTSNGSMAFWGATGTGTTGSVNNGTDLTVTATAGNVTAVNTASTPVTDSSTYTMMFRIANSGDYVMKKANVDCYLNGDSSIYAIGVTNLNNSVASIIKFSGTIDDGLTEYAYRVNGATFSDTTLNYVQDSDHKDLYKLSTITSKVAYNSGTTNVTYSYFIVPAEVTAERSVHFTDGENAILNAIPVIVIIALLLAVVAIVLRSRMD